MQYQIINTCGTSILTNPARKDAELYDVLTKYSNAKSDSEIPSDIYKRIEAHWTSLIDTWSKKSEGEAKKTSAELNCLLTWQRNNNVAVSDCFCYLVHTDTLVGKLAAELLEEWLKENGYRVSLQEIKSLNTDNLDSFEDGLSNLTKWAFETKPKSIDGYSYIFNIAGGFKSVSGFMQILGTFIADQTIYKFEGGNEVLEIPKLPIVWSEADAIKRHFDDYRRISLGIQLQSYSHLNNLWIKDGKFTPWGQLAWESAKESEYKTVVLSFVYDGVAEGKNFRKSVKNLSEYEIYEINTRIDDLILRQLSNGQYNPKRLNYKSLNGKHNCTHECDAWANHGARRLFCNESDGKIIVEELVEHL